MAFMIDTKGEVEVVIPATTFFQRSIDDLIVNGAAYVKQVKAAWKDVAETAKVGWEQMIDKSPWVDPWEESVSAAQDLMPGILKEVDELIDTVKDAADPNNYFQVKSTDEVRASTSKDYNQIMELLGNAGEVNAAIEARNKQPPVPPPSPPTPEFIPPPAGMDGLVSTESTSTGEDIGEPARAEEDPDMKDPKEPKDPYGRSLRDEVEEMESNEADLRDIWKVTSIVEDPTTGEEIEVRDGMQYKFEGLSLEDGEERLDSINSPDEMSDGEEIPLPGSDDGEWEFRPDTGDGIASFKNYDVENFHFKRDGEFDSFWNTYRDKRSVAVEWMMNSGLDFMSNMWDVSIICTRVRGDSVVRWDDLFTRFYENDVVFGNVKLQKFMGDAAAFMVRCEGVDVPQAKSQDFSWEFLWTTIKKVRSKVELTRKSTLKVLLDEPMYFLEMFNLLSNNNNLTDNITVRPVLNVPFTTNPLWRDDLRSKKVQMNIIVKHSLLIRHQVYDLLRDNADPIARAQGGLKPDALPYWVFEDVHFLGNTTDLEFKRNGAETQVIDLPFLFRRLFKVDRQERMGTKTVPDVLIQSPRDPLDATIPTLSNTQHDQTWYYGPRSG